MDLNRRRFLGGAAAFALISPAAAKDEEAHRFRTSNAEIEMTIEFHDGYASQGFWFGEQMTKREYCLSGAGEEGRNCLAGFRGSLAIVRYRVRPRSHPAADMILREHVRTIDARRPAGGLARRDNSKCPRAAKYSRRGDVAPIERPPS